MEYRLICLRTVDQLGSIAVGKVVDLLYFVRIRCWNKSLNKVPWLRLGWTARRSVAVRIFGRYLEAFDGVFSGARFDTRSIGYLGLSSIEK